MSQLGTFYRYRPIETLEGNIGGQVAPYIAADGRMNLHIEGAGFLSVTGDPALWTLTISDDGTVATSFVTDVGTAVPIANVLQVLGAHGINTSAATNVVTTAINNAITLGDLVALTGAQNALTLASGNLALTTGNIHLPATVGGAVAANQQGVVFVDGHLFMHSWGTSNAYLGNGTGALLEDVVTSAYNVGIGAGALASGKDVLSNVAVGSGALLSNVNKPFLVAVGANALGSNTDGESLTAVGFAALLSNTSGSYNTAIGTQAMAANSTGENNVAVGSYALDANTVGSDNSALGNNALTSNTSGKNNVAVGSLSLAANIDGNRNVSVGSASLAANVGGSNNVALGFSSCVKNITGSENTAVGTGSLGELLSGTQNVAVGFGAGNAYTLSESNNISIGYFVSGTVGDNNTIRIGRTATTAHTHTYIAGIDGTNVADNVVRVVTIKSHRLGSADIVAGTGITVAPTANTITLSQNGLGWVAYRNVDTTPYVVDAAADNVLSVDCSGGAIAIHLPNVPVVGRTYTIKDRTGSAIANNITVTTPGGTTLIDGGATFVMNTAYQSITVVGNATSYEVL